MPAATEGQEELVRDASILADRIVERLQNKKARTSILVFDACRNNPFERKGTRAVAGGGGLAPMVQLPEGVFSVFSAGPRQTALDRLSNDDANPNSVFTRTFAKELLQPGENLVQVAQRTRRLVSEMADTVKHRQVPVYFDQMVDDVFLSGFAKDGRRAPGRSAGAEARGATPGARCRACRRRRPPTRRSRASRATMAAGAWCSPSPIRRSAFPGAWRGNGDSAKPALSIRSIRGRARGCRTRRSNCRRTRRPATIEVRFVDPVRRHAGAFPIRFDPEAALIRDQRKILDMTATSWLSFREFNGLLVYYTHLVSYRCAIREVRIGIDTAVPNRVLKMPGCDHRDPSVDYARCRPT